MQRYPKIHEAFCGAPSHGLASRGSTRPARVRERRMNDDIDLFDSLFLAVRQSLGDGSRQQALRSDSSVDPFGRSKQSVASKKAVGTPVPSAATDTSAASSVAQHASASTSLDMAHGGSSWGSTSDFGVEHETSTEPGGVAAIRPHGCFFSRCVVGCEPDRAAMRAALATPAAGRARVSQDWHEVALREAIEVGWYFTYFCPCRDAKH